MKYSRATDLKMNWNAIVEKAIAEERLLLKGGTPIEDNNESSKSDARNDECKKIRDVKLCNATKEVPKTQTTHKRAFSNTCTEPNDSGLRPPKKADDKITKRPRVCVNSVEMGKPLMDKPDEELNDCVEMETLTSEVETNQLNEIKPSILTPSSNIAEKQLRNLDNQKSVDLKDAKVEEMLQWWAHERENMVSKDELLEWKKEVIVKAVSEIRSQTEVLLSKAIIEIESLKQEICMLRNDLLKNGRTITKVVKWIANRSGYCNDDAGDIYGKQEASTPLFQ